MGKEYVPGPFSQVSESAFDFSLIVWPTVRERFPSERVQSEGVMKLFRRYGLSEDEINQLDKNYPDYHVKNLLSNEYMVILEMLDIMDERRLGLTRSIFEKVEAISTGRQ
jgi:hypothetical protein